MNKKKTIGLLGAGRQANEMLGYAVSNSYKVEFFAVNKEFIDSKDKIDIINPDTHQSSTPVLLAVGAPGLKKKLIDLWPGDLFANMLVGYAYIASSARFGVGCIVAPGAVINSDVVVGNHVLINCSAIISHDCQIGDFVTICPGVSVGGNVTIGAGAFVGIGASIRNGINIAPGAVIGAGAVLVKDASVQNGVYVGSPAKLTRRNGGWMNEI